MGDCLIGYRLAATFARDVRSCESVPISVYLFKFVHALYAEYH